MIYRIYSMLSELRMASNGLQWNTITPWRLYSGGLGEVPVRSSACGLGLLSVITTCQQRCRRECSISIILCSWIKSRRPGMQGAVLIKYPIKRNYIGLTRIYKQAETCRAFYKGWSRREGGAAIPGCSAMSCQKKTIYYSNNCNNVQPLLSIELTYRWARQVVEET